MAAECKCLANLFVVIFTLELVSYRFVLFHLLRFVRLATNAFPSVFIILRSRDAIHALGLSFHFLFGCCILATVKATNKIVLIIRGWTERTVHCVLRPGGDNFRCCCCWNFCAVADVVSVDDDDVGILFVQL